MSTEARVNARSTPPPPLGEEVTRGILEAVPGGVVHVQADGAILNANAEALRVLGLSYDALTRRYTSHFEPETIWEDGSSCPASAYPVSRALSTGEPQAATTIGVRRPDGVTAWAVFRAVPLKDEATGTVTGAIVTFLDITERKAAEAERAALEEQLRHAQRQDGATSRSRTVSHNPGLRCLSEAEPTQIALDSLYSLDVAAGEYGYTKAHGHFGWSDERLGFLVEGVRLGTTGFAELPSGADTGSTRNEWMIKASYRFAPDAPVDNELRLKLTYSDEVSNETYLGLTDGDLRAGAYRRYPASALDRMQLHRTSGVLTHVLDAPGGGLRVTTNAYRHVLERAWNKLNRLGAASVASVLRAPDEPLNAAYYGVLTGELDSTSRADTLYIGPNDRTLVSEGVQSVLSLEHAGGWLSHRLEAGVRLHRDEIRRLHTESGFLMTGGQLVPDGEATLTTARNRASTTALALHAIDALSAGPLTLTPGLRVELMSFSVDDALSGRSGDSSTHAILPGLGAYVSLWDDLGALGGVYRGFSPPVPSSADVEPELSINYEAGLRYASGRSRAELIGFYNDYDNLTDICTQSSGCVAENLDQQFDAGAAHIYGLEAFGAHELALGPLRLPMTFAYTFSRGEFDTSFQSLDPIYGSVTAGDELPYVPRHQLGATLGVESAWVGGVVGVNYVGRMREEPGAEPLGSAYATDEQLWFDAGLHGRVFGPLTLYANLRNVFGAQNLVGRRPYGARVNAPRWLQIGAKLVF